MLDEFAASMKTIATRYATTDAAGAEKLMAIHKNIALNKKDAIQFRFTDVIAALEGI